MSMPTPLDLEALVDEYFIENRTRLLEVAAFLDRLDRVEPDHADRDFRMRAFLEALEILTQPGDRVGRIQALLSDPSTEPLASLDRKSAVGAHDRWRR